MLQHGTPWQFTLGEAFLRATIFVTLLIASVLCGFFGFYPLITGALLSISFALLVQLVPLSLSLSRSFFIQLILLLLLQIIATISSFALHYWNTGIIDAAGQISRSIADAYYFSITTFTTLGYGDFRPPASARLITSIEALAGMANMAIGASLVWLWCQENIVPKEMAFFDGYRRNKRQLSVTRIRVRTITGKPRKLNDWVAAPDGENYFWSKKLEEWVIADDTHQPLEGDLVIKVTKNEAPNNGINSDIKS